MIETIKRRLRGFIHRVSPALEHRLRRRFSATCWDNWPERTARVLACPDNAYIDRAPDAGQVVDGRQIMHNGLKVLAGRYYGDGPVELLRRNRGVHEPQEERLFQETLKGIPPGRVMVELGAYWGFYSMWFCQQIPDARVYLVEPDIENLRLGQSNFAANGFRGRFIHAKVGAGSEPSKNGLQTISVDDLMASQGLSEITVLHSDIQGSELEMLQGCQKAIDAGKISYFFISTHSEALHQQCESFLKAHHQITVASIGPSESYSFDGVLMCRSAHAPPIPPLSISRRPAA